MRTIQYQVIRLCTDAQPLFNGNHEECFAFLKKSGLYEEWATAKSALRIWQYPIGIDDLEAELAWKFPSLGDQVYQCIAFQAQGSYKKAIALGNATWAELKMRKINAKKQRDTEKDSIWLS